MSDLGGTPEDRFCREAAKLWSILLFLFLQLLLVFHMVIPEIDQTVVDLYLVEKNNSRSFCIALFAILSVAFGRDTLMSLILIHPS